MKKLLIAAVTMFIALSASAQVKWGVTGGMNFNTANFSEINVKAKTGWNAGLTFLFDLPLGFSLQPSVQYSQKGVNLTDNISQNVGYVEVPVSLQWGPDLLIFRPFVDVTPFVGYAVSNNLQAFGVNYSSWDDKQRFSYGLGLGGGLNVWKLQLLVRYFWNFGSLYNVNGWDDVKGELNSVWADVKDFKPENDNFGGITLGLSFFF